MERGDLDLRGLAAEWGGEPERAVERFPEMLWKSGRSDRDVGSLLAVHGVHLAAMGVLGVSGLITLLRAVRLR